MVLVVDVGGNLDGIGLSVGIDCSTLRAFCDSSATMKSFGARSGFTVLLFEYKLLDGIGSASLDATIIGFIVTLAVRVTVEYESGRTDVVREVVDEYCGTGSGT